MTEKEMDAEGLRILTKALPLNDRGVLMAHMVKEITYAVRELCGPMPVEDAVVCVETVAKLMRLSHDNIEVLRKGYEDRRRTT